MKKWEKAVRAIQTLANAERAGDAEMTAPDVAAEAGLSVGGISPLLAELEALRLVESDREPRHDAALNPRPRIYKLTRTAYDLDAVCGLLFTREMGATPVVLAIVVALQEARCGRRDGWFATQRIAAVLRIPGRLFGGPVHAMYSALDKLQDAGFLQHGTTDGADEYRLKLPWPALTLQVAELLLSEAERTERWDPDSAVSSTSWTSEGVVVGTGRFSESSAKVCVVHDGIEAEFEGDEARQLRGLGLCSDVATSGE